MKLQVTITNIKKAQGHIFIALFKNGVGFPDRHELADIWQIIEARIPEIQWETEVEEDGEYAVTVFHDVNDNQKLDKNWMGIPTEPMGFSNDARPVIGPPSYLNARFIPKNHPEGIQIRLFSM
ncbi:MAG: DUF2141 domain-containing protein [Flavobacteriales bacterium]|nr:DUF2141 domain-containing protein [Flavobacteriales bacterium]